MTTFAAAGPDTPMQRDARLWEGLLDRDPGRGVHVTAAFAARPAEPFCLAVIEADGDQVWGRVVEWPGGVAAPDRTELLVPRTAVWDVHDADHD